MRRDDEDTSAGTSLPARGNDQLSDRIASVRRRVAAACEAAGRSPSSVRLIAVGKTHPPALVQAVVDLGVTDIGESRVQELTAKQARVQHASWHLVGRLQRNKVKDVVGRAVLIHSLDRVQLAAAIAERAARDGVPQRVLVQVNVGDDPAKGGCAFDEALDLVAYARGQPSLTVEGLMTVPPFPAAGEDPAEAARPHFARLRGLRDQARQRWPEVAHLSMGMTADVEAAIAEGATMVRLGNAVFGERGDGQWRP